MLDRETLKARLDNHEEISVSTLAKKNKLLFHFVFVLNVALLGTITVFANVPTFLLPVFIAWILICFLFLKKKYGYLSSAFIKGDVLFITNTKGKTATVYLNWVKKIRRFNFLAISFTTIKYVVDGKINKAYFISDREIKQQPSFIIRFAKQHFKNKRQIYKPGSVF
jgi:hypothetical protein